MVVIVVPDGWVGEVEESDDGWEDGDEFGSGDEVCDEEDDDGDQKGSSQEGGAPVAEETGSHVTGDLRMRREERKSSTSDSR